MKTPAFKRLKALHATYGETIGIGAPLKGFPFVLNAYKNGELYEQRATKTRRQFGAFIKEAASYDGPIR